MKRIACQGGQGDTVHFLDCGEATTILVLTFSKACTVHMDMGKCSVTINNGNGHFTM